MKKLLMSLCFTCISSMLIAQVAGNASFNSNTYGSNSRSHSQNAQTVFLNDSTLKISARIVINFEADRYIAVWGLQEEGDTPAACNQAIDERIDAFSKGLKNKFNISSEDIYVDIVSQAPIYDHEISGKVATQRQVGFELKKNIIYSFTNLLQLEEMLLLASSLNIYDLVKVDYIVNDQAALYQTAFKTASEVLRQKQGLYEGLIGKSLGMPLAIHSENFYLVSPLKQYKHYTAAETSTVSTSYKSDYLKKQARKRSTSYYDGISGNAYDKILKPSTVKVGMQAVMELAIIFRLE